MKYKLSDICSIITDYVANGSFKALKDNVTYNSKKDYARLIRFVDYSRNFSEEGAVYVSEHSYNFLKKSKLSGGELILANVGTIGEPFLCPLLSIPMTLGPNVVMLKTNDNICDQKYLYYYFMSRNGKHLLDSITSSSAVPKFNKTDLRNQEIDLPDLETQKKIVRVLSALDQKIELNGQKNGTYFNICRSLLNNYLSAEDLEEHSLSEFLDVFTGKRNANETSPDGKYIFFSCAPEPLKADTYIFDGSAIIIAGNGAYTGRTRFYEGKMELYQRTYACTPKNNDIQPLIYGFYVYMKNKFEQEKMGGTHGSAIPYIVIGDITKYKIPYNKERFELFSVQVKPFIKAIRENENENIYLANLRDTLLPKLMSGEISLDKVVV